MTESSYIIRGGLEGRERLRLIGRVLSPTTTLLLDSLDIPRAARCLDVGCGGGDVTTELARRVPAGTVVGADSDETKLELARREAAAAGIDNVEYRLLDVVSGDLGSGYQLVYVRFLLTHLQDPGGLVRRLVGALEPQGVLVLEDIDYRGAFCEPPSPAFSRYVELYQQAARGRGVDPDIGPRLPSLLLDAGCTDVRLGVVQLAGREPSGGEGERKLTHPITMEAIAQSTISSGLATSEQVGAVVDELYRLADDARTVLGLPRIVQAWGRAP
jgi:SAM-dependent methyltransferase